MKNKNILDYCDHCEHPMIRCGTCNNNCCNGGSGSVNGEKCQDCLSAYKEQDLFFEEMNKMNQYKLSQEHVNNASLAAAQEDWLTTALEYDRASICQKVLVENLPLEQQITREVFKRSAIALEGKAVKMMEKFFAEESSEKSSLDKIETMVERIRSSNSPTRTKKEYFWLIRIAFKDKTPCMEWHIEPLSEVVIDEVEYLLNK